MKITFLLPHLSISGGVRIGLNYAHLLSQRGHQVKVVVASKKPWKRILCNALNSGIPWMKGFSAEILRRKRLDKNSIPDADIIIACNWNIASIINDYPLQKGLKFQFTMHDERLYHGPKERVKTTYRYPIRKIVISSWIKEIFEKDFNIHPDLLITPVDYNLFHPVKIKKKNNEIKVLMLHHTYKWKGVEEGVRTVLKIKEKIPEIKLALFGVKERYINFPHDAYFYNVSQSKLASLYSNSDIFLCSSWYEGLGMPAMEAMACGCAVVTYDTGGSRDYAIDNKTAFVARNRDEEDLYRKLLLAVNNEELRLRVAKEGYRFINNNIDTWEESVEKLEKILMTSL